MIIRRLPSIALPWHGGQTQPSVNLAALLFDNATNYIDIGD